MSIKNIEQAIAPYQKQLLQHTLYTQIKTPEDLRIFMQHHVFAVWDFMSLLKALQNTLTNTQTPWFPVGNPEVRYLINEIVLAEETDINQKGKRQSHYEMYLDAMEKSGADTTIIHRFINAIESGKDIYLLIQESDIPISIKIFLEFTFNIIDTKKPHQIAAAFTFGREDLIPSMFQSIIKEVQKNFPKDDLSLFKYYFDRHIELDEDEHGPMALKMIEELCGDESQKWEEVKKVSIASLQKRIELWDEIEKEILL
ncbi:DUF3050 domain-containing protein [Mesonia sp. K7]|uniref:DUF3050 domain-containing protein n=1 Tax=Mesonia sp. K7 TaxID=2218606 RepID=UPI000DA9192E|nr:DUF3050 domain-containing protein [Mesonia sp. K7]PZD77717.1 heme oxygenase [Mesonia sp. K7]